MSSTLLIVYCVSFLVPLTITHLSSLCSVQYRKPTMECEEFVRGNECEKNDDILPEVTAKNGGCTKDGEMVGKLADFLVTEKPTPP